MNSEQAQAQHERLQREAIARFESTGDDSGEFHYGGCWCCCWSEPCESLVFEEVVANDGA